MATRAHAHGQSVTDLVPQAEHLYTVRHKIGMN